MASGERQLPVPVPLATHRPRPGRVLAVVLAGGARQLPAPSPPAPGGPRRWRSLAVSSRGAGPSPSMTVRVDVAGEGVRELTLPARRGRIARVLGISRVASPVSGR